MTDALVVDLPKEGTDGWIALFVVLADGGTEVPTSCARRSPARPASAVPPTTSPTRSSRSPRSRARSRANPAALECFVAMAAAD